MIYKTPKNATNVSSYTTNNFNHTNNPIAISFVVHDQPGLFEILFHVMFRPYNSYCIVIDPKSSEDIKLTFQSVLKCYQERFPQTKIRYPGNSNKIYKSEETKKLSEAKGFMDMYR